MGNPAEWMLLIFSVMVQVGFLMMAINLAT